MIRKKTCWISFGIGVAGESRRGSNTVGRDGRVPNVGDSVGDSGTCNSVRDALPYINVTSPDGCSSKTVRASYAARARVSVKSVFIKTVLLVVCVSQVTSIVENVDGLFNVSKRHKQRLHSATGILSKSAGTDSVQTDAQMKRAQLFHKIFIAEAVSRCLTGDDNVLFLIFALALTVSEIQTY